MCDQWIEDIDGSGVYIVYEAEYVKPKAPYEYMQEVQVESELFTGRGYFLKQYDIGHIRKHYVIDVQCIYEHINESEQKKYKRTKVHTFEPSCIKAVDPKQRERGASESRE